MPQDRVLIDAAACGLALLAGVGAGALLLLLRLRRQVQGAALLADRAETLRSLAETLRDAEDPGLQALALQQRLDALAAPGSGASLLLLRAHLPAGNDAEAAHLLGPADDDTMAGLWLCLREGRAFGPGTGRHEPQGRWYLPLRGRRREGHHESLGAACLQAPALTAGAAGAVREHAQALCDQMGQALARARAEQASRQARDEAQAQQLRNTLLAAISHDYRTPLATILGAASALQEQAERLSIEQRRRLAGSIVAEADQLSRLTDNALQLARLDAPGLALRLDWESTEELVGAVLRRLRARDPQRRVRARVEAGLPLLRCDAVLLVQLLDNLVDNALKHGGDDGPVEIRVFRQPEALVLAVRDRGAGVPPALRGRIFDVFQRGAGAQARGTGVGLAVCRAIAQVHGGRLSYRPRGHGGASFECSLPVDVQPPATLPESPESAP